MALSEREGLLTPKEAAEYLKISVYTLRLMRIRRSRGEDVGPIFSRPGYKTVRYSREDLDAYNEKSKVGNA